MGWTKRQLVQQAYEELGLAAYVFDLTPQQMESACRQMDVMIGGWNANGVRIGYPLPTSPQFTELDSDTMVPDFAVEAIFKSLACRIAPSLGKSVSPETKMYADMAYGNMVNQTAAPVPERQMPQTMPRGQGTKPWRNFNNPFVYAPQNEVDAGNDGPIDLQ
jgi:hypothetical protein